MVSLEKCTEMALSFAEAIEQPHFHKNSFRVRKKIFVTLDSEKQTAVLKLNPQDQSVFEDISHGAITPVNGSWGLKGWTEVDLTKIDEKLLKTAMKSSYCEVAPKKLAALYST
jgi:predicted DNA-binding protein (MmcQ/YjbR family)